MDQDGWLSRIRDPVEFEDYKDMIQLKDLYDTRDVEEPRKGADRLWRRAIIPTFRFNVVASAEQRGNAVTQHC